MNYFKSKVIILLFPIFILKAFAYHPENFNSSKNDFKLADLPMKIEIVEYNPRWPEMYRNEATPIKSALDDNYVVIHHFGSTSVPGLVAKPKIDILAVVKNFSSINVLELEKIGFENKGEIIKTGRYFRKKESKNNLQVHLHIFEENNPMMEKNLRFRDWLRTHEEDRNAYAKFKIELACLHDDGMKYCNAKTNFVNQIHNKIDKVIQNNQEKFLAVKKLNLPIGEYAITGSGPLGIRNLKEINDIDIIVTSKLWNKLVSKYGEVNQNGVKKVIIPESLIEIFCDTSFNEQTKEKDEPNVAERIAQSKVIDGLPFESLKNTLYYKYRMGRDKDFNDIKLIEAWQKVQK